MESIIFLWEKLLVSSKRHLHIFLCYSMMYSERSQLFDLNAFDEILKLGKWKPKPGSRDLTDEEKELNKLYTTFIFMKV
jgi:hypothetical protein